MKNRLTKARKLAGLSQADVAKALGITRQAVSLYEKGEREPKLETWMALSNLFGVEIAYLQGISDFKSVNEYMDANVSRYVTSNDDNDETIKNWLRVVTLLYDDAKYHDNSALNFSYLKIFDNFFQAMAAAANASGFNKSDDFKKSIELFTNAVQELEKQSKYPVIYGNVDKFKDKNGNFDLKKYNNHLRASVRDNNSD